MAVDVAEAVKELIQKILGDRNTAMQYAEDPQGTLAAQGITDGDLGGLDMFQVVRDACGDVPGFQNYGSGGGGGGGGGGGMAPPPPAATGQSVDQIMQHLNYVTYVAYEGDETITTNIDNSTNIDQSQNVDFEVHGDMHGDFDVDSHDINANATGDGSAASGTGPAVSGDENAINTGVFVGQQNTGDNAAQIQAVGSDVGPVNTGEFTGIQADGPVNVTGGAMSFGEGDAYNAQGVTVEDGGAFAQGGDATGHGGDDSVEVQAVINSEDVTQQQESGEGDATQDTGFEFPDRGGIEPVRLAEETEGEGEGEGGAEALL